MEILGTPVIEKHPPSLRVFFATEMWERYGFYAVQSLLALYLALHFKWPDKQVYALVASFTALTYLSPLIGGWIADKLIGQKRAILLGAIVLCLCYCILGLLNYPSMLTFSLAGIAVGTGLLKPNISSLLGNEYLENSVRRESGFTIFYMGITTGIILGTTVPSQLSIGLGWSWAFLSAAIGLILAFGVFVWGILRYKIKDYNPTPLHFKKSALTLLLLLLLWGLSFYILNSPQLANITFGLVVFFSAGYILYAVNGEDAAQSRQTLVIGLLCVISIMFWAFYFQIFMSLTLFITRVVQPTFCGINFPAPYYITIESIGMLFIGYFMAKQYPKKDRIQRALSTGKKFIFSMLAITTAYLIIVLVNYFSPQQQLILPLLIIPAYLMISLAELLISPVGLAAITLLAAKDRVSTMTGIFFVTLGTGAFLSGKLANLTAIPNGETQISDLKTLYANAFAQQLGILFVASLGCLVIYAVIQFILTRLEIKKS